ncbi:MAG: transposase, partial [Hyphomicrobium sp.]|nr:transposase [Hyphomicrobium sp.]
MSILTKKHFHDEAAAFVELETILWADGPVCPHCGGMDRVYALKGVRTKPSKKNPEGVERHGLYKCGAKECRKQFTVRIGTIFEETHLPLHKWLQAIHLICSSKKGISANQLHRTLE